ncbi:hypothetical protein O3G_MSEX014302 [Manduca sexta]|uniref:Uncharacterized protein n=1 Tax=Manduca sexta TaxID=7130 RepID=A0A922D182_MANSE|nr:hypothetical protein O3G_MSEX014302 [Manduca sexta]
MYTFCPSSEALLAKCIAAAPPPNPNNKWMLAFRRNIEEPKHNLNLSRGEKNPVVLTCDVVMNDECMNDYEELIDAIETDPTSRWDYIVEECTKNPNLFVLLSERLTTPSIDKLCKHVIITKNSFEFLENFCKHFLVNCIKREYNRLYLDFFVEIHKEHEELYKIMLQIILQDTDIPEKMLSDFITFLNEDEQKEFIKNILHIKLTSENFVHYLPTILNAYKISKNSDETQNYIFSLLVQHNDVCRNNKQYGKLFLAFLQTEKAMGRVLNLKYLKDLLENHITPFRKPCEKILNDLQ